MSWLASQTADDTVHSVPLDDAIVHEFTDTCPCGPTTKPTPMPEGRVGWILSHHSLDGREAAEQEQP